MEDKKMSNEFKDLDTAPTLTLNPFPVQEEKKAPAVQPQENEPAERSANEPVQAARNKNRPPRTAPSSKRKKRRR